LSPARAATAGLLCGFAIISDFLFGPIAVLPIGVLFLRRLRREPGARQPQLIGSAVVCGVAPIALFAAYSYSIFGTLSLPYQYEFLPLFREGMSQGLMGMTRPRLSFAWFLTFHPFRGVFIWSSWVLLALAGCVMATRSIGVRREYGWMGLWAFACALYMNSSYYMWWGGSSMGARLMLPMMAAVPLGLVEVCRPDRSRLWWRAFLCAGAVSCALCVPLSLIDPQTHQILDTAVLLKVTLSSSLPVPQLIDLQKYYSGDWFFGPESRDHLIRVAPLFAFAIAASVLFRTARALPAAQSTTAQNA
jgi:hypothetical protein